MPHGDSLPMKVGIFYDSLGGNTESVAQYVKSHLPTNIDIDMTSVLDKNIDNYDVLILGSYTWGNGKIPKRYKEFLINQSDKLGDKNVFLFGTGNTIYPSFCGAVDGIDTICRQSGARVLDFVKVELSIQSQESLVDRFIDSIKRALRGVINDSSNQGQRQAA
jgi:flavodoxin I